MSADKHPKKEIRKALREAEAEGWEIERKRGHAWAVARCGGGCKISIFSTPADAENHANQMLDRKLARSRGRSRPSRAPHLRVVKGLKPVRRARVVIRRSVVAVIRPA